MFQMLRSSIVIFVFLLLLTGLIYPMVTLAIGQTLFPHQANGSLIEEDGKIIGSELIGQDFTQDIYFHPRPSAAGAGYDASNSSGSNLGPTSVELIKAVGDRVAALKTEGNIMPVPVDLVTASGSGLDPHISPAAALYQAPRVAEMRHLNLVQVQELVTQLTVLPPLGVLGDATVNVLALNRALNKLPPAKP